MHPGRCGEVVPQSLCTGLADVQLSADRTHRRNSVCREFHCVQRGRLFLQRVRVTSGFRRVVCLLLRTADDHHEEFVRAHQRDRRPRGHSRADRPMTQAVGDVSRERRRYPQAEQPTCQRGNRCLPTGRVKHHHRTRVNQPVHRERHQSAGPADLTMRPHERVSVFIRRDRGHRRNAEHRACSRPSDDPICAAHRAPPPVSVKSVVRAMSAMYVSCDSGLGHKTQ
jgi:hypothetical protein